MNDYPKNHVYAAKQAYQDPAEAQSYDAKRFNSLRGRIGDLLDKRALSRAMTQLSQFQSGPLKLLDVPCGTGRMTQFLLERGFHVTGADVSNQMMEVAQAKTVGFDAFGGFHQMDAAAMVFEADAFDCVVSIRFMGHIPKEIRNRILKEFHRVSQYAIIEYNIGSETVTLRRQIKHRLKSGTALPDRWAWYVFEEQELFRELQQAGYQVLGVFPKLPRLSDSHYVLARREQI